MILTKDPDNRIGIQELLDSAFLKSNQKWIYCFFLVKGLLNHVFLMS
jgi:hypothetical protein